MELDLRALFVNAQTPLIRFVVDLVYCSVAANQRAGVDDVLVT